MRPGRSRQSLTVGVWPGVHHLKDVGDELAFHLVPGLGVEIGHLDEVVFLQDLLGDPQGVGVQAHRGDAAALAVPPVVHLDGGEKDVLAGHRHAGGKTGDAAAAFVFTLDDLLDGVGAGEVLAGFPEFQAVMEGIVVMLHVNHRVRV